MKQVLVFGGSTSKTSINKKLATYASTLLNGVTPIVLDFNDYDFPIFSVDEESKSGLPEAVEVLFEEFEKSDGFIISLAEHNGSYAAAFKNIIDWLSRKEYKMFANKPVLLLATSPGGRGGKLVLEAAKQFFPYMAANVTGSFSLPSFNDNFKEDKIVNTEFSNELEALVLAFEKHI